jgi:hypothetical protein
LAYTSMSLDCQLAVAAVRRREEWLIQTIKMMSRTRMAAASAIHSHSRREFELVAGVAEADGVAVAVAVAVTVAVDGGAVITVGLAGAVGLAGVVGLAGLVGLAGVVGLTGSVGLAGEVGVAVTLFRWLIALLTLLPQPAVSMTAARMATSRETLLPGCRMLILPRLSLRWGTAVIIDHKLAGDRTGDADVAAAAGHYPHCGLRLNGRACVAGIPP